MRKLVVALLLVAGCHSEENLGFTVVGEPRWAVSLGGRANDRGFTAAFDSLGDVIVSGHFFGPADFGSGLDSVGGPWPFITKRVASDGAERWTKRLSGLSSSSNLYIGAIAITSADEIVVTGGYVGSVDFGGQTLSLDEPEPPDHGDMFLAKYASDGRLLWVHGLAEYSNASGLALAIDASGAIYVTAVFANGTLVLDGQVHREVDNDADTLLLAYDSNGARRWSRIIQGSHGPYPMSMALASNGDVLVAGQFAAPTSFGGAVVNPDARQRTFLARYRNDGLYLESRAVGPSAPWTTWSPQVRVDAAGLIVIQQVETDESRTVGEWDATHATVRIFADDGSELWSSRMPNLGSFSPQTRTLLTSPNGFVASAAWTDGPYNADDRASVTGTMEVVTFDTDGSDSVTTFGNRMVGAPQDTIAWASAVSSSGAIAFTGQFAGMVDFGTGAMTTRGQDDTDIFVVVVNPPALACETSARCR